MFELIDRETARWQDRAQCGSESPDFMQPERAHPVDVEAAKAVCGRGTVSECPVLLQCRASAKSQGREGATAYGVWAGEWFGEPAKSVPDPCRACGAELVASGKRGQRQLFCNDACRTAFHRSQETIRG